MLKQVPIVYLFVLVVSSSPFVFAQQDGGVTTQKIVLDSKKPTADQQEKLGEAFLEEKAYDKAFECFKKGLELAQNNQNIKQQIDLQRHIAKVFYSKNDNDTARILLLKVLKEQGEDTTYEESITKIINLLSDAYRNLGDMKKAYEYQLKAKQYWEKKQNKVEIGKSLYKIAYLFSLQEAHQEALRYYQKALVLHEEENYELGVYNCYGAISSCYEQEQKYELSLDYALKSLYLAEKIEYVVGLGYAYQNVSANYMELGHCDEAICYMEGALAISSEEKNEVEKCGLMGPLGKTYMKNSQYEKAELVLKEGLVLAQKLNDKYSLKQINGYLADFYKETKQWKEAFYYKEVYEDMKREFINEAMVTEMGELRSKHEVQKKQREKEIAILKKNKEITGIYRKTIVGGALASLIVMSLIALILYYRYKNQARVNEILASTNHRIQLQNQKLVTSNRDLEQFAYIASHDLKEPLRTVGGFTTLLQRRFRNVEDEDTQEYMDFIVKAVHQMQLLLGDLLNYSKIGQQEDNYVTNDLNDIISTVLKYFQTQIKETEAVLKIDKLPPLMARQTQMVQLFQNIIGNALKFRKEDTAPIIHIGCQEEDDNYIFWIKDNGIGIEADYLEKVFIAFKRLHHRGKYEGTGIGLATCKKIIENHEGQIWAESVIDKGSIFYFSIPKTLSNKEKLMEDIEISPQKASFAKQLLSRSRKYQTQN